MGGVRALLFFCPSRRHLSVNQPSVSSLMCSAPSSRLVLGPVPGPPEPTVSAAGIIPEFLSSGAGFCKQRVKHSVFPGSEKEKECKAAAAPQVWLEKPNTEKRVQGGARRAWGWGASASETWILKPRLRINGAQKSLGASNKDEISGKECPQPVSVSLACS